MMGYGYDYPAAKIINDTAAHTGRFGKIVAWSTYSNA